MTGGPDGPDKITVAPCQKKLKIHVLSVAVEKMSTQRCDRWEPAQS